MKTSCEGIWRSRSLQTNPYSCKQVQLLMHLNFCNVKRFAGTFLDTDGSMAGLSSGEAEEVTILV